MQMHNEDQFIAQEYSKRLKAISKRARADQQLMNATDNIQAQKWQNHDLHNNSLDLPQYSQAQSLQKTPKESWMKAKSSIKQERYSRHSPGGLGLKQLQKNHKTLKLKNVLAQDSTDRDDQLHLKIFSQYNGSDQFQNTIENSQGSFQDHTPRVLSQGHQFRPSMQNQLQQQRLYTTGGTNSQQLMSQSHQRALNLQIQQKDQKKQQESANINNQIQRISGMIDHQRMSHQVSEATFQLKTPRDEIQKIQMMTRNQLASIDENKFQSYTSLRESGNLHTKSKLYNLIDNLKQGRLDKSRMQKLQTSIDQFNQEKSKDSQFNATHSVNTKQTNNKSIKESNMNRQFQLNFEQTSTSQYNNNQSSLPDLKNKFNQSQSLFNSKISQKSYCSQITQNAEKKGGANSKKAQAEMNSTSSVVGGMVSFPRQAVQFINQPPKQQQTIILQKAVCHNFKVEKKLPQASIFHNNEKDKIRQKLNLIGNLGANQIETILPDEATLNKQMARRTQKTNIVSLKDSIQNKMFTQSRSKGNSPSDPVDELKRIEEENAREEEEHQRMLEEQDRVCGIELKKYLIHQNFQGMMEFLEQLIVARKDSNAVDSTIKEAAKECQLDPEKLNTEIKKFLNKKLNLGSIFDQKDGDKRKGPKNDEIQHECQISCRKKNFLLSITNRHSDVEENIHGLSCDHRQSTSEDVILHYVNEYRRFINFKNILKKKLAEDEIPSEEAVHSILNRIRSDQHKDELGDFVMSDPETLKKLYSNPLWSIIESSEEAKVDQQLLSQDGCKKLLEQVQGGSNKNNIYETKSQQNMSSQARNVLNQIVSKQFQAVQEQVSDTAEPESQEDKNALAIKLLTKNHAPGNRNGKKKKMTGYHGLNQYIEGNIQRQKNMIEHDLQSKENQRKMQKIKAQELQNVQFMYRMSYIKKLCEEAVLKSLAPSREVPFEKIVFSEEDDQEDKAAERKYMLSGHDETITAKANDLVERNQTIIKVNYLAQRKLIWPIQTVSNPKVVLLGLKTSSLDVLSQENEATASQEAESPSAQDHYFEDSPTTGLHSKSLYNDIEMRDKFYSQAKTEIKGNRQPKTQEAVQLREFYKICQEHRLLPLPIFKCINDNIMSYHGKQLGFGYAKALANMIINNQESSNHLLQIHLDDCNMKDAELHVILEAVMKTKHFHPSLQSLIYSNNEMGINSLNQIIAILALDNKVRPGSADIHCLKELVLNNVNIKLIRDMREFTAGLANLCYQFYPRLAKLSLQVINLNDSQSITNLCAFIEGNDKLRSLTLSQCNLQAKHMVQLLEQLLDSKDKNLDYQASKDKDRYAVRSINLSGNSLSELSPANELKKVDIVLLVEKILEDNIHLKQLNLSGLLLGKKLLQLVEPMRNNKVLQYCDFSNNLLSGYDRDYFLSCIGLDQKASPSPWNCLEMHDPCFTNSFNYFKQNHFLDNFVMDHKQFNDAKQSETQAFDHFINAGIMKRIRETKSLNHKLVYNSNIGQTVGNTGGKEIKFEKNLQSDTMKIKRAPTHQEFVFNELGKDPVDTYDFGKPLRWKFTTSTGNCNDDTNQQYLMVILQRENLHKQMKEVEDQQMVALLKNYYCLDVLKEQEAANVPLDDSIQQSTPSLYIFGSFEQWLTCPNQMQKLHHFACLLCISNREERKMLQDHIMDEVNNTLDRTFKGLYRSTISTVDSWAQLKNAQIVGHKIDDSTPIQSTQVYARYVRPGKHSIFVYDPSADKLYMKILVVEELRTWEPNVGQDNQLEMPDEMPPPQAGPRSMLANQAFLEDTQPGVLDLSQYLDSEKYIERALEGINCHYETILSLFYEMQAECQNTFPLISFEYLQDFCKKVNLLPASLLATETPEEESDGEAQNFEGIRQFQQVSRSQLIKFILWAFCQKHEHKYYPKHFDQYLKNKIAPLVDKKQENVRNKIQKDQKIQKLINYNRLVIYQFMDQSGAIYGFSPKVIKEIMDMSEVPISAFNLKKFYALSKDIVPSEQTHGNDYFNMNYNEFIELVYRIAEFIYDQKNYDMDGQPPPIEIQEMFNETMCTKFKDTLKRIIHVGQMVREAAAPGGKPPEKKTMQKKKGEVEEEKKALVITADLEIIDPDEPPSYD